MRTLFQIENRKVVAGCILALASALTALAADRNVPAQYTTIQAAVSAASSGDTIRIAPGVYVEQITIIGKSLTLAGTPGAIVRATSQMSRTLLAKGFKTDWSPLIGIAKADVTVQDLMLEGEYQADTIPQTRMTGIYFLSSNGRVERCTVQGFRGTTLDTSSQANGLLVINAVSLRPSIVTVKVLNNKFADNQTAMTLLGDDSDAPNELRTLFEVADNLVSGSGTNAMGKQNGILITEGAGGVVRRNTITDHSFTGGGLIFSFGIFATVDHAVATQPIRIEGNTFRNNQLSVSALLANSCQIVDNTFLGPGTGYRSHGLVVSGESIQIASNRFSNLPTGIMLAGNDPDFGTALGITTNATLIGNRFCDVAKPIDIENLVTGTKEQDTLVCPYPDPILAITPAVILNWPSDTEGWILESSSTGQGQWVKESATSSIQGGQNVVSVKTDADHHFFRLRKP